MKAGATERDEDSGAGLATGIVGAAAGFRVQPERPIVTDLAIVAGAQTGVGFFVTSGLGQLNPLGLVLDLTVELRWREIRIDHSKVVFGIRRRIPGPILPEIPDIDHT